MATRFGDGLVAATEHAQRWAIHDPDPATRGQVDALVDAGDPALIRMFTGRVAFGTAGLRAEVGPGPNRMNALVVRQTTAGVVAWLTTSGIAHPRIVIGFDARHDSRRFAAHAAAAVVAGGGEVLRSDDHAPTPVYAHALLAERADAAVVVTASHNPPADNGYKLYLGDGLQLVDPADTEIASLIETMADRWHLYGPAIDDAFADLDDHHLIATESWVSSHRTSAVDALFTNNRDVTVAYTAMHGVGGEPVMHAFESAGFVPPIVVLEQQQPDGDFPTVSFPNPEEPGAFDLVMAVAQAHHVDGALANDPDADRLALAVPSRSGAQFVALSGNELGVLLGDHVLRHTTGTDRIMARSVVSSRQIDAMAAAAGVTAEVTLTGFKWVARPMLTHPSLQYIFGYEEAIGYCVGDRVRDKDGVTAALVAAEMLATLKDAGVSVWQRLDELAITHGVYANHPISIRFDADPARVTALMERVQATPPTHLGGAVVANAGPVGLGSLPATAGLHLVTEDDTQVIVRPSGTEPKIKAYIEVIEPVTHDDVTGARARADQRLSTVVADVQTLLQ